MSAMADRRRGGLDHGGLPHLTMPGALYPF
jgi:hypothetical protein